MEDITQSTIIKTGFPTIDSLIQGIRSGEVTLIGYTNESKQDVFVSSICKAIENAFIVYRLVYGYQFIDGEKFRWHEKHCIIKGALRPKLYIKERKYKDHNVKSNDFYSQENYVSFCENIRKKDAFGFVLYNLGFGYSNNNLPVVAETNSDNVFVFRPKQCQLKKAHKAPIGLTIAS